MTPTPPSGSPQPAGPPAASRAEAVSLGRIREAAHTLAGAVLRTPMVPAPRLSARLDCELFLKLESLQRTGSFKERGALNKLHRLAPEQARAGVVAMSAGNHAQGVAHHARRLGIPATIVMPEGTPFTKMEATAGFGARVVIRGATLGAAAEHARELAAGSGAAFVHPYDDPDVICGQGTVGLEMLEQQPDLDVLVVPVGGGGLIAGVATAAKALRPRVRVAGVQAELFPGLAEALHGHAEGAGGATLAEGIAVKRPGALARAIAAERVDEVLLADEEHLEAGVCLLVEQQHLVAEGAGAAGIAALLQHPGTFAGLRVGVVISGANIDERLLASVLMRGLVTAGRLVRLRIDITDQPGMLARVAGLIGGSGANIIEVYHQRLFHDVPVKMAEVDTVVETRNAGHVREVVEALRQHGFRTRILSTLSSGGP